MEFSKRNEQIYIFNSDCSEGVAKKITGKV